MTKQLNNYINELDFENNTFYFDKTTKKLNMIAPDPCYPFTFEDFQNYGLDTVSNFDDNFKNILFDIFENMNFETCVNCLNSLYRHNEQEYYCFDYQGELNSLKEEAENDKEYLNELKDDRKSDFIDEIMEFVKPKNINVLNSYLNKQNKYLYYFTDYNDYILGLSSGELSDYNFNCLNSLINYGYYDQVPFNENLCEFDFDNSVSVSLYETEKLGVLVETQEELENILSKLLNLSDNSVIDDYVKNNHGLNLMTDINFKDFKDFYLTLDNKHKHEFDNLALVSNILNANLLSYLNKENRTTFNKFSLISRLVNTNLFKVDKIEHTYILIAK